MNTNYSIFIASFYACTAACSFREASFLNSFQSYKIHSFKIVCISSIRFLRQWSFTTCSVDGSGKPCLDIDHCVMLGKASVNMFIVFSSLLNNQWILISPSLANSNVVCEIQCTLNLLICSISNSTRFSNAQFFSSYRLNNAFYVEIWCYDEVIVWNILVVTVTEPNSRCYYFYHFYSVSFTVWARVRGPPKIMLLERSNSEYQC